MNRYLKKFVENDIVERAAKTFVQAAVMSLIVTGKFDKSALIAAGAAGLSATWNYIKTL